MSKIGRANLAIEEKLIDQHKDPDDLAAKEEELRQYARTC